MSIILTQQSDSCESTANQIVFKSNVLKDVEIESRWRCEKNARAKKITQSKIDDIGTVRKGVSKSFFIVIFRLSSSCGVSELWRVRFRK
jgi:hypothetical protein